MKYLVAICSLFVLYFTSCSGDSEEDIKEEITEKHYVYYKYKGEYKLYQSSNFVSSSSDGFHSFSLSDANADFSFSYENDNLLNIEVKTDDGKFICSCETEDIIIDNYNANRNFLFQKELHCEDEDIANLNVSIMVPPNPSSKKLYARGKISEHITSILNDEFEMVEKVEDIEFLKDYNYEWSELVGENSKGILALIGYGTDAGLMIISIQQINDLESRSSSLELKDFMIFNPETEPYFGLGTCSIASGDAFFIGAYENEKNESDLTEVQDLISAWMVDTGNGQIVPFNNPEQLKCNFKD